MSRKKLVRWHEIFLLEQYFTKQVGKKTKKKVIYISELVFLSCYLSLLKLLKCCEILFQSLQKSYSQENKIKMEVSFKGTIIIIPAHKLWCFSSPPLWCSPISFFLPNYLHIGLVSFGNLLLLLSQILCSVSTHQFTLWLKLPKKIVC